ncbi:MAG: hypothetical protein IPK69_06725 [Phycisphaerales bacterium]|nr:MAG: hypothetical protein IPK69_06725 [Phycisphaerales bacterium]
MHGRLSPVIAFLGLVNLIGMSSFTASCASHPATPATETTAVTATGARVSITPGSYAAAFDAARESLRAFRFPIERVDSREGVISTDAKQTSGLATPWDREQSTLAQEAEDLLAQQARRVRITFSPADSVASADDLTSFEGTIVATIEVVVERTYVRNFRPSSQAILLSSQAYDPVAASRGQSTTYAVPLTRDDELARRLARDIEQRAMRN